MTARLALTYLYVPGDRPDRVRKALGSDADVVLCDLEDAVAPERKDEARAALVSVLAGVERRVQVRINDLASPWAASDLAAVRELPAAVGVRVPKVEDPSVVHEVAAAVPGRGLHLLVESALGVERAFELARAHPHVASLGLGEADLRSELGVDDDGLVWIRSRIVVAARAAGLVPPIMSVYPHVDDPLGLAESCARGRSLGFRGRAAIHPRQLTTIREAFIPSAAELARARAVVAAVESARAAGAGTAVLPDGGFVDVAMVAAARAVLALER